MTNFADLTLAWYRSPHYMDLTDRQRVALITLARANRPLGVGELAWTMGVPKPVICRIVDALPQYVERLRDPEDGRLRPLQLTEAGWALVADMRYVALQGVGL